MLYIALTATPERPSRRQTLFLAVLFEGGMGLVAVAIGAILGLDVLANLLWRAEAALWGLAATLPLLFVLVVTTRLPVRLLQDFKRLVQSLVRSLFSDRPLIDLAIVSLLAGIGEELLFRGLIQQAAAARMGTAAGLLTAAILFGLVHPLSLMYVLLAAAIGVYLGWLYVASGNLLVPIIAHAVYDFIALIYLRREPPVENPADEAGMGV